MRASIVTNSVAALLVAAAIVWHFSPVPGSFWGATFFGLPYSISVVVVPVAAVLCAAAACWIVRRRPALARRGAVIRGISIGATAFLLYGIFHATANAIVALASGAGLTLALVGIVGMAGAIALFGGLFIMPICCTVAVGCEWLAGKIAA